MRGLSDWYGSWNTIWSLLPQRAHAGAVERARPRSAARRRSAARGRAACARASSCRSRTRRRRRAPRSGATRGRRRRARARLRPRAAELHLEPARLGQRRDCGGERGDAHRTAPPAGACVSGANRQADSWSSPTGRRLDLAVRADLAREVAARVEAAARRADRPGRAARPGSPAAARARCRPAGTRPAAAACTGAAATPKTVSVGPVSTMLAGVHHGHAVAGLGDHAEVVGDQEQRQAEVAPQLLEQREHLRLRHDVERGRRLVGDHDLRDRRPARARSSRAGACRPRTRAGTGRRARALMPTRSSSSPTRSRTAAPVGGGVVQADGVADLARDALHGVERVERALEDERDLAPAQVAHAALGAPVDVHDAVLARRGRSCPRAGAGPGASSCMIASAVVVLPQPDSPARPSASPRAQLERDARDDLDVLARRRGSRRAGPRRAGRVRVAHDPALRSRARGVLDDLADGEEREHEERDRGAGRHDVPPRALVDRAGLEAVVEQRAPRERVRRRRGRSTRGRPRRAPRAR